MNATVTATFSQGAPWKFQVITYDTPVQTGTSSNTSSFVIPTAFKGDRLATMEAAYPDGSGAGPQNWTTYKEYGAAYQPSYTANTVTLPSAFFAETNDGTVNLTFHFWSGAILKYALVKSGSTVTGTAVTPTDPTDPTATPTPTSTPTPTGTAAPGSCTARYSVVGSWSGGFQATVDVSAATTINGWRVTLVLPSGTSISSLWNGVNSGSTGTVTVSNAAYNGSVGPNKPQSFGFIGTGSTATLTPTCTPA